MSLSKFTSIGCASLFLLVWLTGWSAGTLFFDYMFVSGLISQYESSNYQSVPGVIAESRVVVTHDSDGTSRHPEIKYEYHVGREKLKGDKIRFGMEFNGMGSAKRTVNNYAVGSEHKVFYDPDEPTKAALRTGLAPADFFLPIFLTPFNMIMIGLSQWVAIALYIWTVIAPTIFPDRDFS